MKTKLTKNQKAWFEYQVMEALATTSTVDIPEIEEYFENQVKQMTDLEAEIALECELQGIEFDRASEVAYTELAEDGQLNSPTFDTQFEKLVEKYAEDFRAERIEAEIEQRELDTLMNCKGY